MTALRASLAMYPFGEVRATYQRLWDAVVERCPDLPATLTWPLDVDATWTDDDVLVKQACGWPLVTRLGSSVRVVGAFEYAVPNAVGHRYRSAIVATRHGMPDDFDTAAVAYNSTDSLSGWVSLLAWSGRPAPSLLTGGVATGSHAASLELLRDRRADVASIDAVTLAHLSRHRPDLLAGLVVVGRGPLVPSLPLIVPSAAAQDVVVRLRAAWSSVIADDGLSPTLDALHISGFVPLDLDEYRADLAELVELAAV